MMRTPVLPAHVEDTVKAIAEVHLQHHRKASRIQRVVDMLTNVVARPWFVLALSMLVAAWIAANLLLRRAGDTVLDPPPFQWLQDAATLIALLITVLILITQRRENLLTERRQQLTLELSILAEQKTAKIIELLEELRRDDPQIRDRVNPEADEMAKHADPQAVLDAIRDTHEQP